MTPRTFEDWLRQLVSHGGSVVRVNIDGDGTNTITLTINGADQGPKVFRVIESRVEPATFDSPSQGGSDEA